MVPKMLIIVMLVASACAATWYGRPPKKPKEFENKEGCYIVEIKDVIPYGTNITAPGECYVINCDRGVVDYASCGIVGTEDPQCHVTPEDTSKPYPQCCPDIQCDLDNSVI